MPRRILEGVVTSSKMDKTCTVLVERRYMHPIYKKYLKRTDKYAAHDENNICKEGDRVQIIECAPISKRKRWTLHTGGTGEPKATVQKASKKAAPKKAAAPKAEKAEKAAPAKKPAAKKAAKTE